MKVVTTEHIDYVSGNFGVRVWRNMCRSITHENGRWIEYGADFPVPVPAEYIDLPANNFNSVTSLACNLIRFEEAKTKHSGELRKVLLGKIRFDDALSTSTVA